MDQTDPGSTHLSLHLPRWPVKARAPRPPVAYGNLKTTIYDYNLAVIIGPTRASAKAQESGGREERAAVHARGLDFRLADICSGAVSGLCGAQRPMDKSCACAQVPYSKRQRMTTLRVDDAAAAFAELTRMAPGNFRVGFLASAGSGMLRGDLTN